MELPSELPHTNYTIYGKKHTSFFFFTTTIPPKHSSPRPSHQNMDQFTMRHSHMPWLQDELGRWNPNHFHCCWRNPSKVDLCDTKRNDESASESKKTGHVPQKCLDLVFPQSNDILLMEAILHPLGCIKPPCKYWDNLSINWCRISSINSMYTVYMYHYISKFSDTLKYTSFCLQRHELL